MKDLSEFDDVMDKNVQVEQASALEFEFGGFVLRRERNRWEIQFEDAEGEQELVVEREDFTDGRIEFDIDGRLCVLTLEDFDRIEEFSYKNGLIR